PGRLRAMLAATQPQSLALAEGVVHQPLMLADNFAVRGTHFPRPGRQVLAEKFPELAFTDETDAGAVPFCMVGESGAQGALAHFAFMQIAQREQTLGQRVAVDGVQKITLILGGIARFEQPYLTVVFV